MTRVLHSRTGHYRQWSEGWDSFAYEACYFCEADTPFMWMLCRGQKIAACEACIGTAKCIFCHSIASACARVAEILDSDSDDDSTTDSLEGSSTSDSDGSTLPVGEAQGCPALDTFPEAVDADACGFHHCVPCWRRWRVPEPYCECCPTSGASVIHGPSLRWPAIHDISGALHNLTLLVSAPVRTDTHIALVGATFVCVGGIAGFPFGCLLSACLPDARVSCRKMTNVTGVGTRFDVAQVLEAMSPHGTLAVGAGDAGAKALLEVHGASVPLHGSSCVRIISWKLQDFVCQASLESAMCEAFRATLETEDLHSVDLTDEEAELDP